MRKLIRAFRASAAVIACGVALTACASVSASSPDPATGSPAPQGSASQPATPTPLPSGIDKCFGVGDADDAAALIASGRAVALVRVSIEAQPWPNEANAVYIPVASAELLAGELPTGDVAVLEVSAAPKGPNPLPPADYVALVGTTPEPSTYYLAAGLYGSFVMEGERVTQRCPNAEQPEDVGQPEEPRLAQSGVTDPNELAALFAKAFAAQ